MRRTRILVVEDDPIILDLITTRLDLAGYDTYFARDGVEGLARLHELRPRAMVLDLNMPRLDGFGLLRKMALEGLSVPTMVLTARNQPDDVKQAIALGARDFLSKPFKDEQLLQRVGRLLRKARPKPAPPPKADPEPFLV
ncbi:response regulator with CheY-like receiver, AAA-type ATPase, and DNA-binding domains [Caulobacter sp. AP07]|uniref:response regulator transcription factor n=1 Tax=Caulobacter sp. AP07 TaxID=1144304 RepID=UPI000271FD1F|nr:response regulator [Caulobacter sp. AP07]EJL22506.1 response regulator with CheY-like receiver, AAA-type ATPase, and DNA-binding domains [Caulobacter sp. AP07]